MSDRPTLQQRILATAVAVIDDPEAAPDEVREASALIARRGRVVEYALVEERLGKLDPVTLHRLRDLVRSLG